MSALDRMFLGNPVSTWLLGLGIAAVAFLLLRVVRRILVRYVSGLSRVTKNALDDVIAAALKRTHGAFLAAVAALAGARVLSLDDGVRAILARAVLVLLAIQGGLWAAAALGKGIELYRERRSEADGSAAATMAALGFVGRLLIWGVVVLLVLENLGIDITALVAGLGVGGVAIALAVQNVLGDLFASLSIMLDRPFVPGDFLAVDDYLGSVEHIGLKTTRVRSISGEQLVFSNADLLTSRIRNYGRMYERRILFTIGVTYDTPPEKVARIPGMIREAIESRENTRFDRSHFRTFGPSSLDVETVYYVTVPDYATYMDIQQQINLDLLRRFADEGIEFAFPTRTIHVESPPPDGSAR
ncbi:MAG: mechanosensitive ion channel family protein [Gemmatimonadota bacterium]